MNSSLSEIPEALMPDAVKALEECRLFWVVTDQYGRPCNGGDRSIVMPPVGVWAEKIEPVQLCFRGYHCTSDPIKWEGQLVWLVEVDKVCDRDLDKIVCHTRRALALVDPYKCLDARVRTAAMRPNLRGMDLRGAKLSGAELSGADLSGARLSGASLREANLRGARLSGARLRGADLSEVDLRRVDLIGAELIEVDLSGADLIGVDLSGVALRRARLSGARLRGARLRGANLREVDLSEVDLSEVDLSGTLRRRLRRRLRRHLRKQQRSNQKEAGWPWTLL